MLRTKQSKIPVLTELIFSWEESHKKCKEGKEGRRGKKEEEERRWRRKKNNTSSRDQ